MGNLKSSGDHTCAYDAEGRPVTVDSVQIMYDAFGRVMEQNNNGTYTQFLYSPSGNLFATMNGSTVQKYFVPLVAGMQAVYNDSGLQYYRHSDWLGTNRFAGTPSGTVYFDGAYAPFGETYAGMGTSDRVFTGQTQDTVTGVYDFPFRQQHPVQGRWLVPDPAGLAAVDITNPQTWNRYAYVGNNPLNAIDPYGLFIQACFNPDGCSWSLGSGGVLDHVEGTSFPSSLGSNGITQEIVAGANHITFVQDAGGNWVNGSNGNELSPDAANEIGLPVAGGFQSLNFIATALPGGSRGSKGGGCNDSKNNRSRFFTMFPLLNAAAAQLNVPSNFIVGLSSYESAWLDNHNYGLHNLFGLTNAGGNNLSFPTFQAGVNYFVNNIGPYVQNAQTIPAFFKRLGVGRLQQRESELQQDTYQSNQQYREVGGQMRRKLSWLAIAYICAVLLVSCCATVVAQSSEQPRNQPRQYTDVYSNPEYGYKIKIPRGFSATGTAAPNPNHGVRISFPISKSYIWVDAGYTDADSVSHDESDLGTLCEGPKNVSRSRSSLAGFSATQLTYRCGELTATVDVVAAIRSAKGRSNILYQVGLFEDNSATKSQDYRSVFLAVVKSFKVVPLR